MINALPKVIKMKRYSVDVANSMPDHLFIYGDNAISRGEAGQAQIRRCKNAYGIPTKKFPRMDESSFFSDSELEYNKILIKEAIDRIPDGYKYIVFPEDGLGTGLSQLPQRAGLTYKFLNDTLNEKFGHIYD